MTEQYIIRKGVFQHITLEGTSYEIGRKQAEILKSTNESSLNFFTSEEVHPKKYGFATFKQVQNEYEVACPGINDEIQGFADELGLPIEKIMFYDISYLVGYLTKICVVQYYVSQSRGRYSMTTPVEIKGERFLSYSAPRLLRDNAQRRRI